MKKRLCIVLAALLLCAGLSGIPAALAEGTLSVTVQASKNTVAVGETFSVQVGLSGVAALGGLSAFSGTVTYDAEVFTLERAVVTPATGVQALEGTFQYSGATPYTFEGNCVTFFFRAQVAGETNFRVSVTGTDAVGVAVSGTANSATVTAGNNRLASLRVLNGTMLPSFNAELTTYSATVLRNVTHLELEYTTQDENATVEVENPLLQPGIENLVRLTVTAPNGAQQVYRILVVYTGEENTTTTAPSSTTTTAPSSTTTTGESTTGESTTGESTTEPTRIQENIPGSSKLRTLAVVGSPMYPGFRPERQLYQVQVSLATKSVMVVAVPQDRAAKVAISGEKDLQEGENTVTVTVTSTTGATTVYTIMVYRTDNVNEVPSLELEEDDILPEEQPTPEESREGMPWWGIALIVLAILAVLGVAAYFLLPRILERYSFR